MNKIKKELQKFKINELRKYVIKNKLFKVSNKMKKEELINKILDNINNDNKLEGGGFFDNLETAIDTANEAKKAIEKIGRISKDLKDVYTSPISVKLRKKILGTNIYEGELHQILKLPDGSFKTANFSGPNTQLLTRLKNEGNKNSALSTVDRIARQHDINFFLAKNIDDIRKADELMIKQLLKAKQLKKDSILNIEPALRIIQGKIIAEKIGLLNRKLFLNPDNKELTPENIKLVKSKIETL